MGRDAVTIKAVKEENSRTGIIATGRITGLLPAAKMKAGEMKAAAARDIRIIRGVRRAAVPAINLLLITAAVLDRIAETRLPENEVSRGKALRWILLQLRQKRDRRTKSAAEIRTETNDPERI